MTCNVSCDGHVTCNVSCDGHARFACRMHTPVFYYSTRTVSNQKTKVGYARNDTIYDGHVMVM